MQLAPQELALSAFVFVTTSSAATSFVTNWLCFIKIKAMKSSPLLGPFCGSQFLEFENIARLSVFMFQTSDNSQLCIDSQYSS